MSPTPLSPGAKEWAVDSESSGRNWLERANCHRAVAKSRLEDTSPTTSLGPREPVHDEPASSRGALFDRDVAQRAIDNRVDNANAAGLLVDDQRETMAAWTSIAATVPDWTVPGADISNVTRDNPQDDVAMDEAIGDHLDPHELTTSTGAPADPNLVAALDDHADDVNAMDVEDNFGLNTMD